jgi:hypothetical protein
MTAAAAESPDLLSAVRQALGEAGILDWRAHWHPASPAR